MTEQAVRIGGDADDVHGMVLSYNIGKSGAGTRHRAWLERNRPQGCGFIQGDGAGIGSARRRGHRAVQRIIQMLAEKRNLQRARRVHPRGGRGLRGGGEAAQPTCIGSAGGGGGKVEEPGFRVHPAPADVHRQAGVGNPVEEPPVRVIQIDGAVAVEAEIGLAVPGHPAGWLRCSKIPPAHPAAG